MKHFRPFTTHNSPYQANLTYVSSSPVQWLWPNLLPLAGITLLDGDHGTGKSLLALQIAACVSSGSPLPDGSPTIQGGVVIITPYTDSCTTQLQILATLGADLSCIEILSFLQKPSSTENNPDAPTSSNYRPFSLPEDIPTLFSTIQRLNARLVILDPFIHLLSHQQRCTNERLRQLLSELNQYFIERDTACLLIRNYSAKGGHARPSALERSDHFSSVAVSRLLLAPNPLRPDRLLLSHALSHHGSLSPTRIFHIQPQKERPHLPQLTLLGFHTLHAQDLIENRPDILHRRLLAHQLLKYILDTTDPIPVSSLYSHFSYASPFQIQRSLKDLLNTCQIERPARGFYTPADPNPVFPSNIAAATEPISEHAQWEQWAQSTIAYMKADSAKSNETSPFDPPQISPYMEYLYRAILADPIFGPEMLHDDTPPKLNSSAATTPILAPDTELNTSAATTFVPKLDAKLNSSAATTPIPSPDAEPGINKVV